MTASSCRRETRRVLALAFAAALNAPIPETKFGVFSDVRQLRLPLSHAGLVAAMTTLSRSRPRRASVPLQFSNGHVSFFSLRDFRASVRLSNSSILAAETTRASVFFSILLPQKRERSAVKAQVRVVLLRGARAGPAGPLALRRSTAAFETVGPLFLADAMAIAPWPRTGRGTSPEAP